MREVSDDTLAALCEPFPVSEVKFRVGSVKKDKSAGQALAYIDARNAQDRLDEVVGPSNWQCEFLPLPVGVGLLCKVSILVDGVWVGKQDGASLENLDDASDDKRDMATKGLMSDAFKRACVMWGIGRYLYNLDAPWVALRDGRYLTETPKLPAWALPKSDTTVQVSVRVNTPPQNSFTPKARPLADAPRHSPATEEGKAIAAAHGQTAAEEVFGAAAKPAVQRAAAPAPAPAAPNTALPEGAPALGKTATGIYEKFIKKVPLHMLTNFLNGPKAAESTTEEERVWLLKVMAGGAE